MDADAQRQELDKQRRRVDFDSYDVSVDELLRRVEKGKVDVAPTYQRKFRWDEVRQSALIESIFLGIPVPPLFMATSGEPNQAVRWEVVDGLQRVTTLVRYAGSLEAKDAIGLQDRDPLRLTELDKLKTLNRFSYKDLSADLQSMFEDRPLKVVVLNDKSELRVRFDLFERLNTGGIKLTHQEVRECVFRGEFIELLNTLSGSADFRSVVKVSPNQQKDGTYQEFALRFFAYLNRYKSFEHSVKDFLDDYCSEASADPSISEMRVEFEETFRFLSDCFPNGIHGAKRSTPVNLFEGVAVGAALARRENPRIAPLQIQNWNADPQLKQFIYGATNTKTRVVGRIEHCRDKFLGN